jgi:hypothetical protein
MLLTVFLVACSAPPPAPIEQEALGGGFGPERVVESFFEDLGSALTDQGLAREDRRTYWVERLVAYFAPNERDDQRALLRQSFAVFAGDLAGLAANETLTLELQNFDAQKVSEEGERATVRLPEATISMLITRTTERGVVTVYEQPIVLERLIGRPDGTIPLVRVAGRWYLTEG